MVYINYLSFLLVILCTFSVTPKLQTISYSSKSEEVSNYTKNTLNDTSDNNGKPIDDVLRTLATKNTPTDEDDDLITANENPEEQIKSTTNTLPSSVPSSSSSILCSSGLNDSREYNDALWPLLWLTDQQRPMRRKLEKLHYPATSFSSINERSKFNELKVLGSTASITTELKEDEDDDDDMSIAGSDVRPQSIEIYTNTTANPMRNGTNVVAASDNPNHASDRVRLQAPNDNSPRQRQSQQVNHLKFYKSNSLFPLSFGQLPQSLKEPKYPKQKQQLSLPQVHHTDSAPHTKDEDAAVDDDEEETVVDDVLQHHQHPFADYRLLFNAERYTEFYLYTLTRPHEITQKISLMGTRIRHEDATSTRTSFTAHYPLNASMAHDGGRVLNIVSDTIGAVFGVNVPPVASMQGIHLEPLQLYNSRSLRQSRFNPFNPTR